MRRDTCKCPFRYGQRFVLGGRIGFNGVTNGSAFDGRLLTLYSVSRVRISEI